MRRLVSSVLVIVEEIIPGLLLLVLTAVVGYGVIMRYVFGSPVSWTNELATALFVWILFLASAGAARNHMHLGVDAAVILLSNRWRAAQELIANAAILLILLCFIYLAWGFAQNPTKSLQMIGVSYTWIYLAVPVGFGLTTIHVISDIVHAARGLVSGDYQAPISSVAAMVKRETEGFEQVAAK